jgi:molybdopterin synthase catalytic subunit
VTTPLKKIKTPFVEGSVSPAFIAEAIAKHAADLTIGAHQLFLGQIRSDDKDGASVSSMEFTTYRELADTVYSEYREQLFSRYSITCMHVYHSLGTVKAGEINLFVFVSAKHRKDAISACADLVEWIKAELPVWGKESLEDHSFRWKNNS